jgi:hypothetical protein
VLIKAKWSEKRLPLAFFETALNSGETIARRTWLMASGNCSPTEYHRTLARGYPAQRGALAKAQNKLISKSRSAMRPFNYRQAAAHVPDDDVSAAATRAMRSNARAKPKSASLMVGSWAAWASARCCAARRRYISADVSISSNAGQLGIGSSAPAKTSRYLVAPKRFAFALAFSLSRTTALTATKQPLS